MVNDFKEIAQGKERARPTKTKLSLSRSNRSRTKDAKLEAKQEARRQEVQGQLDKLNESVEELRRANMELRAEVESALQRQLGGSGSHPPAAPRVLSQQKSEELPQKDQQVVAKKKSWWSFA